MREAPMQIDDSRIIREIYTRRSPYYDLLIRLLSLNMEGLYRRSAVKRLALRKGDKVLDLGCGTGLNFPLMAGQIGPEGFILGVDSSVGMLERAKLALRAKGASNISLVAGDVLELGFKGEYFDALISTYLFSTIPEYERGLTSVIAALKPGGRFVFTDDILPGGWFAGPMIMLRWAGRYGLRNYCREIISFLKERAENLKVTRHHLGLIYIISGTKV